MNDLGKRKSDRIEYLGEKGMDKRRLFDLSTTGACFYSDSAREKDAGIEVTVNDVHTTGRVVYCAQHGEGYRLGIQFSNLSDDVQRKINQLVDGYSKGVPVSCSIRNTGV